ncbi:MAG: CARDB domain-containing protein [Saprospiraceae bacterium]
MKLRTTYCLLFFVVCAIEVLTQTQYSIDQNGVFSPLSGNGDTIELTDDELSGPLPIGFAFAFFDQLYDTFYISSNGFITFSSNLEDGCCQGQFLPDPNLPNNLIAFAWGDLNPEEGGTISYFLTGVAPERKLVVDFEDVAQYNGNPISVQLILLEGSNQIEIHTTKMSSNGGLHTMGIENIDGTVAFVVTGRNSNGWTTNDEFVRFAPIPPPAFDAGIINIIPSTLTGMGKQPIKAIVLNFGQEPITDLDINWSINDTLKTPVHWSGNIIHGLTDTIQLDSYEFKLGSANNISAWSSLTGDINYQNDSFHVMGLQIALNGHYYIGNGQDFQTINEAVDLLNEYGVVDSIIFSIAPGTYQERVIISEFPNASCNRPVIFQSLNGDSTSVIISNSATSLANNYIVYLSGADGIVFRHLTLEATGNTYARVLWINNGAFCNRFENNIIKGHPNATNSSEKELVFSPSTVESRDDNNIFKCNKLIGGSYGIRLGAQAPNREFGTKILNNFFQNQFVRAISVSAQNSIKIEDNKIFGSQNTNFNYIGIELYTTSDSVRVLGNSIIIPKGEKGIMIWNGIGNPYQNIYGLVANNFIVIKKGFPFNGHYYTRGIDVEQSSTYQKLYYNTVRILSPYQDSSTAFYLSNSTNIVSKNNIWSNESGGYAAYQNTSEPFFADNNCLYSTGSNLGFRNGTKLANLATWQAATGQDSMSVSVNPLFSDSLGYHISEVTLDGGGKAVPEILFDLDGDQRDPSNPDIGADEFTPTITSDAGITNLLHPSFPFLSGNQAIEVVLRNFGTDTLNQAIIGFSVNGNTPTYFNWAGLLPKGKSDTIAIGNYNFMLANQYQISAWTQSPNGTSDQHAANDTTHVSGLIPSMGGNYTIGGMNPDFINFTQAVAALHFGGILDDVVFSVRNGIYSEHIEIHDFVRGNNGGIVLFKSENEDSTSVTLTYQAGSSVENYTILLNGADSISFQFMTIASQGDVYGQVVVLQEGATYNEFSHNLIKAYGGVPSIQPGVGGIYVKNHATMKNLHNAFRSNRIEGGSFGIINYQGGSEYGIFNPSVEIINNTFIGQSSRPLEVFVSRSSVNIIGNKISFFQNQNGNFNGMNIYAGAESNISKNRIELTFSGAALSSLTGVSITSPQYISGRILLSNNFVSVYAGNSTATGILISGRNIDVLHNNVLVDSKSGFAIDFPAGDIDVINNIFVNIGGGATFKSIPIGDDVVVDNNDYFTNGDTLGVIMTWPDWEYFYTLADWQYFSNLDSNSLSVDPLFTGPFDLHVNTDYLNDAGQPLDEVTDDIDGNLRDPILPDIGADEFLPSKPIDAGILAYKAPLAPFPAGSNPVFAVLRNYGSDTLYSAILKWKVNGILQPDKNWAGVLATGDTASILLGSFVFLPKVSHKLVVYTVLSNDIYSENDTLQVDNVYAALEGIYTIGGSNPDFQDFRTANNTLIHGGVLAPVEFLVRNGFYQEQFYLNKIKGASNDNSITYRSEANDSTLVTLTFAATEADSNYTICLDGASWITLQGMTLQGNGPVFARVIDIRKGANQTVFKNNRIRGSYAQNASDSLALVFKPYEAFSGESNLKLLSNRLEGGSYGLWYEGFSTLDSALSYLTIGGNEFVNQYFGAIDINAINFPVIENNQISNSSQAHPDYQGISNDYYYDGSRISFNKINLQKGRRGLFQSYGVSNDPDWVVSSQIDNNFISMVAIEGVVGLEAIGTPVYFNSVNLYGTIPAPSSRSFEFSGSGVYNNIFTNFAGGYAIYSDYAGNYTESNYNCYYTNGPALGYIGHPITNLASWQLSSGQDSATIAENPIFISNEDLHVIGPFLNEAGIPVPGISHDIDGEARDLLHPDIGADEFSPALATDAGLVSITSPLSPFELGPKEVSVVLRNFSTNTLNTATIELSIDGLNVKSYQWSGQLNLGEVDTVIIDTINFSLGAFYDVKLWVTNPNGMADMSSANDTVAVENLHAFMAGIYTIGGTQPDFYRINDALDTLHLVGMMDTVTFQIRNGVYEEQMSIHGIPGNDCYSPVIFQPENWIDESEPGGGGGETKHLLSLAENDDSLGVTIIFDSNSEANNYIIHLDSVRGIIFRGLCFKSLSQSYGRILQITERGPADCHIFTNNSFLVAANNTESEAIAVEKSFGYTYQGSVFTQNRIEGGKYGIVYNGIGSASLAGGLSITENIFIDQTKGAIDLKWVDHPGIVENQITSTQGDLEFYGISIAYSESFTISKNKISIYNGGEGIHLSYCNSSSSGLGALFPPLISNNFIYVGGDYTGNGISILNNSDIYRSKVQIFYNNIHFAAKQGSSLFISNGGGFNTNDDDLVDIVNNNLINSGDGFAFHYNPSFSSLGIMDYNNLYSTGEYVAALGASLKFTNLQNWQNASNKDVHSLSVDPYYLKFDDLHVQQPLLNEAGIKITQDISWHTIWDDIDGDTRDALHPDIGADEFTWKDHDIRISALLTPQTGCALGEAETVTVQIQNIGKQTEQDIWVGFTLDTFPVVLEYLPGLVLTPGQSVSYSFSNKANMLADGVHELIVFSKLSGDENLVNDTLSINLTGFPPMQLAVTPDTAICFGDLIQITANVNGPATFQWNNGETTPNIFVYPDSTSSFWVSATNIYGCTLADTTHVIVNMPTIPQIIYAQDTICGGTTIDLSVDEPGTSLLWSTYETSTTIQIGVTGLYSVKRTDENGCTATSDEVSITALSQPTIQVNGFLPLCKGDSIELFISNAVQFLWSNGGQQASIQVAPQDTTTYSVVTTNAFGCVDTLGLTIPVIPAQPPPMPINLLPQDSSFDLSLPLIFSWQGTPLASVYDLYSWPANGPIPSTPTLSNLNQLNYVLTNQTNPYPYFEYGTTYNWYIVAKNSCYTTPSNTQTFSLRHLPDLVIDTIITPIEAYSGHQISINWVTRNQGLGKTIGTYSNGWYDEVYLSMDSILDFSNNMTFYELGYFSNTSSLEPGDSYARAAEVIIPEGLSGNMYLFVVADKHESVDETDEENNRQKYSVIPITLTSPPDLHVLSVVTSSSAFSGEVLNVQWTVVNQGQNPTRVGNWSDEIWISPEPIYDPNSMFTPSLGINAFQDGILAAGQTYTASKNIVLPEGIWGTFYIYVNTDNANQVYENPFEQNNAGRSAAVEITLKPPPDLVVSDWSLPDTVSNHQEVLIHYTLLNQGGSTITKQWIDRIFWSTKEGQLPKRTVQILDIAHNQDVPPGGTLQQSFVWTVPDTIAGLYDLVIYPDYSDEIYEYIYEDNNKKKIPVEVATPDLIVTSVSLPDTAWSGQSIPISYVIKNIGRGDLIPRKESILDKIYVHVNPDLNFTNPTEIEQVWHDSIAIHAGDSLVVITDVTIPNGISGPYYLSVYCDVPYIQAGSSNNPSQFINVHEQPSENNNIGTSGQTTWIWLSPWWDLVPLEFSTPDTVNAGEVAQISIDVKNDGPGPVQLKQWADGVFWGQTAIASIDKNVLLPVDSSYQETISVTMPCPKKEGIWYLQLKVDANKNVYEFAGEDNNELLSDPIYFKYPEVDLAMGNYSMPDTIFSSRTVKVKFLVSNLGAPAASCYSSWYDDIYFSKDSILDSEDQHFRHLQVVLDGTDWREVKVEKDPYTGQKYTFIIYHVSSLTNGSTYRLTEDFEIPDGISGQYYFIAKTDTDSTHSDPNRSNNTFAWPVQVLLSPPPDLTPTALTVSDYLFAGEKMTVEWTVENQGIGEAYPTKWWDAVYFSTDFTWSPNDIFAGELLHNGALQPGQSYQKQAEITVQANLSGNYLMLLVTDSRDSVYEHQGELNNVFAKAVVVNKVPPADLIVTEIIAPDTVLLGQYDSICWMVKNIGTNPAEREFVDAVYLSADAVFDASDVLFGTLEYRDPIVPQQNVTRKLSGTFSGLKVGSYYVLVITDIQDKVPETDNLNNQLASPGRVQVMVEEMFLDIPEFNDMPSPHTVFYRLEIPDSLAGESLLLEFDGDSVTTFNELYLQYDDTPTRVTHDFSSKIPFAAHHEIVVPELLTGTYYTMACGKSATPDTQATRLLARILNFELRAYNPAKGANSGTVTIELKGSKFDANMLVRLQNGTDTIPAQYLYYISPTHAFARFDLNGATPGLMDFWMKNQSGDTFTLPHAFEVVTGASGQLVYHAVYPEATRVNQITPITIEYANGGLTDLIDPKAEIKALLGAPLALSPDQLGQEKTILILPLQEFNGPTDILRPGAIGSVTVYTRGPKTLLFVLYLSL